jgi:hypothetical protein
MPYGLDGTRSDSPRDNLSLERNGSKSDARTLLPPQEYHDNHPDYRPAAQPDYRAAPLLPITTYPYGSLAEPVNRSPQWFDFPHLTRHPVPAALPVWASVGSAQNGGNAWCPQLQTGPSSLQTSHPRNYDDPVVHHSVEAGKVSISSLDSGIIMPPNPIRGPGTGVSRNDRPIPCPQFEPAAPTPPFSNYAQHNGHGHMRIDAAHYQYGHPSEPRSACLLAKCTSDAILLRYGWPTADWEHTYGPRSAIAPPPRPSHVPHPKGSEYSQGHILSYSGHY